MNNSFCVTLDKTSYMFKLLTLWRLLRNPSAQEFLKDPSTCSSELKRYLMCKLFYGKG